MLAKNKGNNPIFAAAYLFKGMKLLLRPELRKFLIFPLLINLVLYSSALFIGSYYINELMTDYLPGWLQWLNWILWPLFFISFFIVVFFTFTILANLLAAPFYGKLSAKALTISNGQTTQITEPPIAKIMVAECRRAGYFLLRSLPILLLFAIPGINLVAPFLWAVFGAWAMALEYLAYPLENNGLLFSEQKQWVKSIRIGTLSFGGAIMAGLTLPIVNIIVAPAAVIGASLYVNDVKS